MNARAVENGLTIALGKAAVCAIYSVRNFVYDRGRDSRIGSIPRREWKSGRHGVSVRVTGALVER